MIASIKVAVRAKFTHRHTPLVVWVQDLYTVGLAETGQGSGAVVRVMSKLEGWLLQSADRVVVIHARFARRLEEDFGIAPDKIEVVRNWTHLPPAPKVDVEAFRAQQGWDPDETVVLHAGNMGVKQGLDNVVEAARLAQHSGERVRFALLGGGAERERLRVAGRGISTLQFIDSLGDADFLAALASADCLLVNEAPGISEMAVPSKLTSYFSAGRAVIAATDLTGITAEEVTSADAGVVIPAGNPQALVDAALHLSRDPHEAARLGANGRLYRETVLDEESALDHFERIAESLARPKSSTQEASHAPSNGVLFD